ncbi:hypothetical protein P9112_003935 [Eukaryota sp. TZLM1-RC]
MNFFPLFIVLVFASICCASQFGEIEDYQDFADWARRFCRNTARKDFPEVNFKHLCDSFGTVVMDVMDTSARNICENLSGVSEYTSIKRAKEFPFVWTIEQATLDSIRWLLSTKTRVKEQDIKVEFTKRILDPWMNLCSNTKSGMNIKAPEGTTLDSDYIDRLSRKQQEKLKRDQFKKKDDLDLPPVEDDAEELDYYEQL